jgi:TolB-like protein
MKPRLVVALLFLLFLLALLPHALLAQETAAAPAAPAGRPEGAPPAVAQGQSVRSSSPAKERIAVMPIQLPHGVSPAAVHCPICGLALPSGEIKAGADERLTEQVYGWLTANRGYDVFAPGMAEGAYQRLLRKSMTGTTVSYLQGVGKELGADAVLGGILYRYRERVGTPYSASRAASIGFDLHLVRTSDGAVIWSNRFDETQQTLTENIFNLKQFFKRGVRWLTADEFATHAVAETMKDFPRRLPAAAK